MYSYPQLISHLSDGTVALDLNGHFAPVYKGHRRFTTTEKDILAQVIYQFQRRWELYHESSEDKEYGEHAIKMLELLNSPEAVRVGEWIVFGPKLHDCPNCGKRPNLYLKDANTLSVMQVEGFHDPFDFSPCSFADGAKPKVTHISVPSGQLVFANFFRGVEDSPEGLKYTPEWSLNSLQGRHRIADYLATQGFGFGQTSNMGVYVYVNKAGDTIRIMDNDGSLAIEETSYYKSIGEKVPKDIRSVIKSFKKLEKEGFTLLGDFHCEVWRWMCADKETLNTSGAVPSDNYEPVECQVKQGTWEVTHYFDLEEEGNPVVSELKLKG